MKKLGLLLLMVVATSLSVHAAGTMDKIMRFYHGPRYEINTLLLLSGYVEPMMLGDLVQDATRQPYLRLPATQEKDQERLIFCPVSPKSTALEVRSQDFSQFLKLMRPGQIIVLGDSEYVPQKYIDAIPKEIPVTIIYGNNWNVIAEKLGDTMNLQNLAGDYKVNMKKIQNAYRPINQQNVKVREVETPVNAFETEPVTPEPEEPTVDKTPATGDVTIVETEDTVVTQDGKVIDEKHTVVSETVSAPVAPPAPPAPPALPAGNAEKTNAAVAE